MLWVRVPPPQELQLVNLHVVQLGLKLMTNIGRNPNASSGARSHISEVASDKRKSAYGDMLNKGYIIKENIIYEVLRGMS